MSYDFEKAFDKISWKFIDKILEKNNFGHNFRNMIKFMNEGTEFCTMNCGYTSKYRLIERGIRQGNPASSLVFDLAVEFLGEKIRQDNKNTRN